MKSIKIFSLLLMSFLLAAQSNVAAVLVKKAAAQKTFASRARVASSAVAAAQPATNAASPFVFVAAWYGFEGPGTTEANKVWITQDKIFDANGNVSIPATATDRAAKYGAVTAPTTIIYPKVVAFAITYNGVRYDYRAFDGAPFTLTPARLSALQNLSGAAPIAGPVTSASYRDPVKNLSVDVTTKVNALIACQGGAFFVAGYLFDGLFTDPSLYLPKTLSLTFANGTIVTCQNEASKGLYLTAADITNLSSSTTSFTYPSSIGQSVVFNKLWEIPTSNDTVYITFQAAGLCDIYVAITSIQDYIDSNSYCFIAGGFNNEHSEIWRSNIPGASNGVTLVNRTTPTTDAGQLGVGDLVTGGNPGNGTIFDSYWFGFDAKSGLLFWGKGTVPGQNIQQAMVDPNPIQNLKYFGLGSLPTGMKFQNIQIIAPSTTATAYAPAAVTAKSRGAQIPATATPAAAAKGRSTAVTAAAKPAAAKPAAAKKR